MHSNQKLWYEIKHSGKNFERVQPKAAKPAHGTGLFRRAEPRTLAVTGGHWCTFKAYSVCPEEKYLEPQISRSVIDQRKRPQRPRIVECTRRNVLR